MNLAKNRKPPARWLTLQEQEMVICRNHKWQIDRWVDRLSADGWEFETSPHDLGYLITCKRRPE